MNEIFTIGYGGRETGDFVALLNRYEIDTLVDVRSQPYSRYAPDFCKERLSAILESQRYRAIDFMGHSLGGRPDDSDCYTYSPQRKKKAAGCQEMRVQRFLSQRESRD